MKYLVALFAGSRAKNNEEYRAVLKKRQKIMLLFILTGMATVALALAVRSFDQNDQAEHRTAYLMGLGVGLAAGGGMGLAVIRRRLKDEEKLKEARLKETDERELAVSSLALKATAKLLLAALYVLLVLSGLFVREETQAVCLLLVGLFLLCYVICRKYYEAKL